MLEDMLFQITSWIPTAGGEPAASGSGLPLSYVCSVGGALILSKFTGSLGMLTVPVNAAALFVGASIFSMFTDRFDLPLERGLEQPLLTTIVGMIMAALVMLVWMKRDGATVQV